MSASSSPSIEKHVYSIQWTSHLFEFQHGEMPMQWCIKRKKYPKSTCEDSFLLPMPVWVSSTFLFYFPHPWNELNGEMAANFIPKEKCKITSSADILKLIEGTLLNRRKEPRFFVTLWQPWALLVRVDVSPIAFYSATDVLSCLGVFVFALSLVRWFYHLCSLLFILQFSYFLHQEGISVQPRQMYLLPQKSTYYLV